MGILGTGIQEGLLLKPIRYQWAMDLYDQAVANTWFPNEIQLGEDIADFKKMTDEEKARVEEIVNSAIAMDLPMTSTEMPRFTRSGTPRVNWISLVTSPCTCFRSGAAWKRASPAR